MKKAQTTIQEIVGPITVWSEFATKTNCPTNGPSSSSPESWQTGTNGESRTPGDVCAA